MHTRVPPFPRDYPTKRLVVDVVSREQSTAQQLVEYTDMRGSRFVFASLLLLTIQKGIYLYVVREFCIFHTLHARWNDCAVSARIKKSVDAGYRLYEWVFVEMCWVGIFCAITLRAALGDFHSAATQWQSH